MLPSTPLSSDLPSAVWDRLERILEQFQAAWRAGGRPAIKDYLAAADVERRALLVELIHEELELRLRAGEAVRVEDYLGQFPDLGDDLTAAAELVAAEFVLRQGRGEVPRLEEYQARFPQFAAALPDRIAARRARVGGGPIPPAPPPGEKETLPPGEGAKPAEAVTQPPPAAEPKPPQAGAGWPTVPGYEIVAQLGKGGMGVVYKAHQTALRRTVALKMILHGDYAGPEERRRFQTEAGAVARLQHPQFVQVYEVGEHKGLPFFSLEFCPGGSLEKQLDGKPWEAKRAAALVETLARAMHAAHQAGLVHRDLKPGNVLLTPDGTPKVTDFGLAKRLDVRGDTQTGVILGTPEYMAPEQAGKSREVGPAADTYALGAILYELMTGRPPFQAATPLDTILQVVGDEPVPPSRLYGRTPRDLETICVKCLQKQPGKRYDSALSLAQDLRHFQNGEPITARPVGRTERAWRWCRRNPAVASLATAVLLVFAAGTVASSALAALADRRAGEAAKAEGKALQEAENSTAARNDLQKSNDKLLTSVARSLLRPLGLQAPARGQSVVPLSDPEIEALWELESSPEQILLRFVGEAIQRPVTTRQLKNWSMWILHAAVGLDVRRREVVERMLAERMSAEGMPLEQRVDLAWSLVTLDDLSLRTASRAFMTLTQAIGSMTEPNALHALGERLSAVGVRLGPKEAAEASTALAQAMSTAGDSDALVEALLAVTTRLEPGVAAETVVQAMDTTSNSLKLPALAWALSAVAARMEPKEAVATLTQAMSKPKLSVVLPQLAGGLSAVAARMDPKDAVAACRGATEILIQAITRASQDPNRLQALAQGLAAVATHLQPNEAAVACRPAAAALAQALSKKNIPSGVYALAEGLSAVAARLEPKEAATPCAKAAAALARAIGSKTDIYRPTLPELARSLAAVAARLEPQQAQDVAAYLVEAISKSTESNKLGSLAEGLCAVAARMEPQEAAIACRPAAGALTQAISKETNEWTLQALVRRLSAVTARLEPHQAREVADGFARAMVKTTTDQTRLWTPDHTKLWSLAQGLSAAAAQLDRNQAKEVAAGLARAMNRVREPYALYAWARGLSAVAARMDPRDAAGACTGATEILTRAMTEASTDPYQLQALAQGLSAVMTQLEPKQATLACRGATEILTQAITKETNPNVSEQLAQGLSAVAARLEPKQAAAVLAHAMNRIIEPSALLILAGGLLGVANRLQRQEADAVCREAVSTLVKVIPKARKGADWRGFAQILSAMAVRLEPKQAGEVSEALTGAMTTRDPSALPELAGGLSAVAYRLEPTEAAAVCKQAAVTLTSALNTSSTTDAQTFPRLTLSLSAVLTGTAGTSLSGQSQRAVALVTALSSTANGQSLLSTVPLLYLAGKPLQSRLSTPQLVELLKNPLCVGEASRIVLEVLGARYKRQFANQWEFVHFAQEQNLGLDFTSPPERPAAGK
jgi:hypothetical protein